MKRFFVLSLIILSCFGNIKTGYGAHRWEHIWDKAQQAMAKSTDGVSEIAEHPSATTQLLSAMTGIQNSETVLVGLEMTPYQGWTIHHPLITAEADSYQSTVFPQFRTDLPPTKEWNAVYEQKTIFPILLEGKPKKDITLRVTATWMGCPPPDEEIQTCLHEKAMHTLKLPVGEAYPTTRRAALNRSLITAAVDIEKTAVQTENRKRNNGDIEIRLTFPQKVQHLDIRAEKPYTIQPISMHSVGRVWRIVVRPAEEVTIGDVIPFSIRTTKGCYTMNLKVSDNPLPLLPEELPFKIAFWSGILFFLLSPLWSLWLCPQAVAKTGKDLNETLKRVRMGIGCVMTLFGLLWSCGINLGNWIQFPLMNWIAIAAGCYLIWKPIPPTWVMCLLVCLLPKPFWDDVAFVSTTSKCGLLLWWFACCFIPFNIWVIAGKHILKFFKQQNNVPAYQVIVRLPYLIMTGWILSATLLSFFIDKDPTPNVKVLPTPALIRVTEPVCLTCIKDRAFFFSSLKKQNFPIYRVDSDSEWARQKRQEYGLPRHSFNILIADDGKEMVLPAEISQKTLSEAMKQLF